jgi:hypothetical protein
VLQYCPCAPKPSIPSTTEFKTWADDDTVELKLVGFLTRLQQLESPAPSSWFQSPLIRVVEPGRRSSEAEQEELVMDPATCCCCCCKLPLEGREAEQSKTLEIISDAATTLSESSTKLLLHAAKDE